MSISTTQAQTSVKRYNTELSVLNPATVIYLFEIDVSSLVTNQNIALQTSEQIFRFHNNIKLTNKDIFWSGGDGIQKKYTAAPINVEGFEINSKGTLPTPKMSISVNEEGVGLLSTLKSTISSLGDLTGAKVTRIRTFLKFLDAANFESGQEPQGFTPDPNIEYRDVFYIDRKSAENRSMIEYELASLMDIEGIQLPGRLVLARRCTAFYRGEGCMYEYNVNRVDEIHGSTNALPTEAPPVANDKDEKISDIIGSNNSIIYMGAWNSNTTYNIGNAPYLLVDNIKYYYVSKASNTNKRPPNDTYWISDACSKCLKGCRLRWGTNGSVVVGNSGLVKGQLPFVGFPGAEKVG